MDKLDKPGIGGDIRTIIKGPNRNHSILEEPKFEPFEAKVVGKVKSNKFLYYLSLGLIPLKYWYNLEKI